MARTARGTFAATGASSEVIGVGVTLRMTFAGTATVALQFWDPIAAAWVQWSSHTGTLAPTTIADNVRRRWRLNCSAHTNDVTYVIETGRD